jgi:DNA-binding NarL/FixJ family response regulator
LVAKLAASGLSNREVAARTFLVVKTEHVRASRVVVILTRSDAHPAVRRWAWAPHTRV